MNANLKKVLPYLAIGAIILLLVLYLGERNDGSEVDEEVVSAAAPATIGQPATGQAQTPPAGSVHFCIRLDGRQDGHLPALIGGGPNSYSNGQPGGYNWGLMPNATGDEDYGVMADGTVFAKLKFLSNNMNSFAEYIGEPAWVPIKMSEGTINGQPALTYKIPNF